MSKALTGLVLMSVLAAGRCNDLGEDEVRDRVSRWLSPGESLRFTHQDGCTAAVFPAQSTEIKSAVRVESDPEVALYHLGRDGVVAIEPSVGMTANDVTETIATRDFPMAVSVIRVGQSAQPCMAGDYQTAVYRAVNDPHTVLILDAEDVALTILDRTNNRIFYLKGAE